MRGSVSRMPLVIVQRRRIPALLQAQSSAGQKNANRVAIERFSLLQGLPRLFQPLLVTAGLILCQLRLHQAGKRQRRMRVLRCSLLEAVDGFVIAVRVAER